MGIRPSLYNNISIQKDGRAADIRLATASISFYEDILSPNITAKIHVIDVGGSTKALGTDEPLSLYESMQIRGGEAVFVDIAPNSDSTQGINLSTPLYVNSVRNVFREGNKEFLTLNLTTRAALTNEKTFLYKKYETDAKISDHVRSIVSEELPSITQFDVDETSNNHGFLGNLKKPFEILLNLASKSVFSGSSGTGGSSAGFLFYDTLDGSYFKAIDNLVNQEPKEYFYYAEAQESELAGGNTDYRILRYEIIKNQSIVSDMRKGSFSTKRTFFDPVTFDVTGDNFNFIGNSYEKMSTLNEPLSKTSIEFEPRPLSDQPSRIITETFDRGTVSKEVETKETKYIQSYLSQRKVRYNSLFSQIISVMVPSNTNIHAGDVVECSLPSLSGKNKSSTYDRRQLSGNYLVKEVCHHFDTTGSYTNMKLVRDSFQGS